MEEESYTVNWSQKNLKGENSQSEMGMACWGRKSNTGAHKFSRAPVLLEMLLQTVLDSTKKSHFS